jgi:Fe-S oxidoreductase
MLHAIKTEEHGPLGGAMAQAVQTCVHCGFCLAACPTYQELGQEMDSPRGRIVLMKQVLEGTRRRRSRTSIGASGAWRASRRARAACRTAI